MKLKDFAENFIGAIIGVVSYNLLLDISEPFQTYWANYLAELALISICVFLGILLVQLIVRNLSFYESEEKA